MGLTDWFRKAAELPARLSDATTQKALRAGGAFRRIPDLTNALAAGVGGGQPGGWASNHQEEARNVTGWNFCAVRAVARTVAKCRPMWMATGKRARRHIDQATKEYKRGRIPYEVIHALKSSVTASNSGDDAVPLPPDFAANRLMRRPNQFQSRPQFLFQLSQQLSATGTALLWTRRNQYRGLDARGVPVEKYVIPTGITIPQMPSELYPEGSYRVQPVGTFGGVRFSGVSSNPDDDGFQDYSYAQLMMIGGIIDAREVRPIRWPHPLFLTDGQSPAAAGDLWIDIASQLDRATWYGFRHTMRPGYIFQMTADADEPNKSEAERFDREVAQRASGIGNIGKSIRLPKGVEIADADRSVHELDYVQGREAIGENVMALHSTPKVVTGMQPPGAYAAYYASMVCFSEQAIEPQLMLIADEIETEDSPAYGEELELHMPAPPINDKQQREGEMGNDLAANARTLNEWRKERNLPPWPDRVGGLPVGTPVQVLVKLIGEDLGIDAADLLGENQGQLGPDGNPVPRKGPGGKGGTAKEPDLTPPAADKDKNPANANRTENRLNGIGKARPGSTASRKKELGLIARYEPPGYFKKGQPVSYGRYYTPSSNGTH